MNIDKENKIKNEKQNKTDENNNININDIKSNNSSFSDEDLLSEKTNSNDNEENIYDKYKDLKEKYSIQKTQNKSLQKK